MASRKVDDGVLKIVICVIFVLITLFFLKIFISGCRIIGRHLNVNLYWKDSWIHQFLSSLGRIRINKVVESVCVLCVCALSVCINPIPVQADKTGQQNIEVMSQDEGIAKIEKSGQIEEPKKEEKKEPKKEVIKEEEEKKEEEKKEEERKEPEKVETVEKKEEPKKESAWEDIPLCETISPVKTYMDDEKITLTTSEQWKLFNEAKYGEVITDDLGFQYIEGEDPDTKEPMKFYTVALGTYYMSRMGEKFRVTMENGFQFGVITGDMKSNAHTHPGNNSNNVVREGFDPTYCVAGSNDMLEFIIDSDKMKERFPGRNGLANNGSMNANFDDEHMFEGRIVKIELLVEE